MKEKQTLEVSIHFSMAFTGGFFGAYALLNHCDIFGSSQTANLISLVTGFLGRNPEEILIRLGAAGLYALAIILSVLIPRYLEWDLRFFSIMLDGAAALLLYYIPAGIDHLLGLYPIFFAMAFQWCAFKGVYGYNCSTIFSTNNFRQTILGFTRYLCDKDPQQLQKGAFYGGTLMFFHLGVLCSYLGYLFWGLHASVLAALPLTVSLCLVLADKKCEREKQIVSA